MLMLYIFVLIVLTFINIVASENAVVCYYGSWATYRNGLGKFNVEDINPNLCSHLIYAFAGIDNKGNVISLDPYLDLPDNYGRNYFGKFNALKQKNPSLKTLLAVGGWNEGSSKYSIMAANSLLRQNFIDSAIKTLIRYGFDGLDVDWEYPNRRDTVHGAADIDNFTSLLRGIREEFDKRGFLLTAAVSSVREAASQSYNVRAISQYLDIVNIMTYDMHGAWDPITGHNAPLYNDESGNGAVGKDQYTVDQALDYWIGAGCPPEKMALGVPFYSRTFTLANATKNGVGAPASGAGLAGPYTGENGFMGYNELCYLLQTESWNQRYDNLARVPYAFKNKDWVSYDDASSIITKMDYAKKLGITKVMIWSIETDDFHGICGEGINPLLKAIAEEFNSSEIIGNHSECSGTVDTSSTSSSFLSSTVIETSSILSSTPSSTDSTSTLVSSPVDSESSTSSLEAVCKLDGYAAKPGDCSSFYYCVRDDKNVLVPKEFRCPANLYWDQTIFACNYQDAVKCDN